MSTAAFDPHRRWVLDERVSVRPEPFGALVYHFGTRRLSFLKTRKLAAAVEQLAAQPTARAACVAAGVTDAEIPAYDQALAELARAGTIRCEAA